MDDKSASHRELYLTKHKNHKRQTSMPPVGYEPTNSSGERPHTHTLDRANIHIAFDEHKHVMLTDKLLMATRVIGAQIHHTCNSLCSVYQYIRQHLNVRVMNYEQNM
jgi:hypothetical protein